MAFFSLIFFYTSYFLFPWKKAVPEQKEFQKAKIHIKQGTKWKKSMQILLKNSLTVVWMLIKEACHTDLMSFYCNVLKADTDF